MVEFEAAICPGSTATLLLPRLSTFDQQYGSRNHNRCGFDSDNMLSISYLVRVSFYPYLPALDWSFCVLIMESVLSVFGLSNIVHTYQYP